MYSMKALSPNIVGARFVGAAVMACLASCLASSAFAQLAPSFSLGAPTTKTQEEKDAEAARDKAYKESLKKIPDAKGPADPWGNARSLDAPKQASKETSKTLASPKARTKTGSTAN
jgi:hypothetical protein